MHSPYISALKQSDTKKIIAFLRQQYGEKYYGADEVHFEWLYQNFPCDWFQPYRDKGLFPGNAIFADDGTINALHLYLPFDAQTPTGTAVGIFDEEWISNGVVKGGGRLLASHLLSQVNVYCGLGCNDLSENAFKKIGLTFRNEIPRLVAVLDKPGLSTLLSDSGYSDAIASLPQQQSPTEAWHLIENCSSIPSDLIQVCWDQMTFGVPHDRRWLDWRFDQHPYISYQVISPDADGNRGVAVIRIEQPLHTGLKVARIVDFLAPHGQEGSVMMAAASFAVEQNCLLIDFTMSSEAAVDTIQKQSALKGLSLDRNPHVPYMYQPCAYGSKSNVNMAIWTSLNAEVMNFSAVKSDSTQDVIRSPDTAAQLS